jgi:hypothetical protein
MAAAKQAAEKLIPPQTFESFVSGHDFTGW